MSYIIATDTSANLPTPLLQEKGIVVVPFSYYFQGEERICLDTEAFDGPNYYQEIKSGALVSTSQIPPQRYVEYFTPVLQQEQDILYLGMSSGISGSFHSAEIAAAQLQEEFPQRNIRLVDTLAASLGEGLLVLEALSLQEKGLSLDETADILLEKRQSLYQVVVLDDLMYLKRGGRISSGKALVGTILDIKPILKGNAQGELVVCGKVRGRRKGLHYLAQKYTELVADAENQVVAIAYTDCPDDAAYLAELIRQSKAPKEVFLACYEPVTGAHIGPGVVALFFMGQDGIRAH